MPFLLAEILNFQGSTHLNGVGSLSKEIVKNRKLSLYLPIQKIKITGPLR